MSDTTPEPSPASETSAEPNVPPKRLPWIWALLLLVLLPLIALGIWLAGAVHQADDRPPTSTQPAGMKARR